MMVEKFLSPQKLSDPFFPIANSLKQMNLIFYFHLQENLGNFCTCAVQLLNCRYTNWGHVFPCVFLISRQVWLLSRENLIWFCVNYPIFCNFGFGVFLFFSFLRVCSSSVSPACVHRGLQRVIF